MTRRYSHSYLDAWQRCPLRAHYQFDLKLHARGEDGTHHLAFGRAAHEAWRVLYAENDIKKAQATMHALYPKQIDLEDLGKTADNACFAIECYVKEYNWDKGWKILSMEEMDAGEDDYVVKLDMVVEDIRTGDIIGVDHKFTGSYLNADFFNQFNPNSQVTQYYKYIIEKYGRCDGFTIDAVSLRHRSRASTFQGVKQAAGPWVAFERLVLNRTPQQIEQDTISRDDTIADIERCRELGRWRMHTSSCRWCPYRTLCAAGWDWENDSELILQHFRQVCDKWVPPSPAICFCGDEVEKHHVGGSCTAPKEMIEEHNGFHCQLDAGHDGVHSPESPEQQETIFEVEL